MCQIYIYLKAITKYFLNESSNTRIVLIVLFALSCERDNGPQARWEIIDLNYSGELTDISVVGNDTIYILCYIDNTGQNTVLFKSFDAGKTWEKNSFPKIDEGGFRYLFCLNSSILLAGGVDGIYCSNDGGINWKQLGLSGQQIKGGVIYFLNKNIGFVAQTNTIYKTLDGGISFTEVFDTAAIISFSQIQFINNQVGYVSGGAQFDNYNIGIIVKTTDGGNTWYSLPRQFKNIIGMSFITPEVGYLTVSLYESNIAGIGEKDGVELLKTTDGGNTWTCITNQLLDKYNMYPECLFIDEENGFMYGSGKILSSTDGGITWVEEFANLLDISPIKIIMTQSKTVYAICHNRFVLKRTSNP